MSNTPALHPNWHYFNSKRYANALKAPSECSTLRKEHMKHKAGGLWAVTATRLIWGVQVKLRWSVALLFIALGSSHKVTRVYALLWFDITFTEARTCSSCRYESRTLERVYSARRLPWLLCAEVEWCARAERHRSLCASCTRPHWWGNGGRPHNHSSTLLPLLVLSSTPTTNSVQVLLINLTFLSQVYVKYMPYVATLYQWSHRFLSHQQLLQSRS